MNHQNIVILPENFLSFQYIYIYDFILEKKPGYTITPFVMSDILGKFIPVLYLSYS